MSKSTRGQPIRTGPKRLLIARTTSVINTSNFYQTQTADTFNHFMSTDADVAAEPFYVGSVVVEDFLHGGVLGVAFAIDQKPVAERGSVSERAAFDLGQH